MVANTAWAGGTLLSGGGFTSAFIAADLNGLANLSSVLSSTAFDNTVATLTTPDQFMDISFVGAFGGPSGVVAGAGIGLWLYTLAHDGTTYGSGRMVAGTQAVFSPLLNPLGGIPLEAATYTTFAGSCLNVTIPPRAFRLALQNQTGFAFAGGGACSCSISTYRQQTNA